jgi:hypothetical protein
VIRWWRGWLEAVVALRHEVWGLGVSVHLGLLRLHRAGDGRYYVILPPSPVLQAVAEAGKRVNFTVKIVAGGCRDKELDGKLITFARKVTDVRRRNGSRWFRLMLPTAYNHVWNSIENCGAISLDMVL